MKSINKYLFVLFVSFIFNIVSVYAASYDISVTSNSVVVGNSITLTIKGNDVVGRFNISATNGNVISLSKSSVWIENNTETITISTKNVGSSTITIIPTDITNSSAEEVKLDNRSVVINVKSKPVVNNNTGGGSSNTYTPPKSKSSNSNLSSITIDNFQLKEKFDKEVLEYNLELPARTEKIKVNAQLEDSRAKVVGVGEIKVSEGINNIELIVTAENGSKKTYIIKALVLEEKPIEVSIGNEKYNVIRRRNDIPKISEYFIEKDIEIDGELIEGYHNETLGYDIVGLKNKKGLVELYIYKDKKYDKYLEYTFNGITIQLIDKELPKGYVKTNFIYDGDKIPSYQEGKVDIIKGTYALDKEAILGNNFYLFYGLNLETGDTILYQYDSKEKTIQRYNTLILDMYKDMNNKYYISILISILLLGLIISIFGILLTKSKKKYVLIKDMKKAST